MNLKSTLIQMLCRPRKVHGLPGRLRIHLPFLLKIDSSRRDLAALVSALVRVPEAIHEAEVSLTTGNVLIGYDGARLSEDEVMEYVRGLLALFVKNRERFQDPPPDRIPRMTKRLEALVRDALDRRLALDTQLEIPDDVLA